MAGVCYFLMKTISLRPESVDDSAEMEKVGVTSSTGTEEGTGREVEEKSDAAENSNKLSLGKRISVVLFLVFVFALLIEAGQALLPASFQRGFSWGDLAASMVGGLVGCYPLLENRLEMRAVYPKNK